MIKSQIFSTEYFRQDDKTYFTYHVKATWHRKNSFLNHLLPVLGRRIA